MNRGLRLLGGLLLCGLAAEAAAGPDLPRVKINGAPLPPEQVEEIWRRHDPEFATRPPAEREVRLRQALEWEFCRRAVRELLQPSGLTPSPELAAAELARWEQALPAGIRFDRQHQALAQDPDFQLAMAFLLHCRRTAPDKLRPTPAEIEDYYRSRQLEFIRPDLPELELLYRPAADPEGRSTLENARMQLLQGADFEALARRINPEHPPGCSPQQIAACAARLRPGEIDEVRLLGDTLTVIRLIKPARPGYLSLAEMTPYLTELLSFQRAMRELQSELERARSRLQLEITPPPPAVAPQPRLR